MVIMILLLLLKGQKVKVVARVFCVFVICMVRRDGTAPTVRGHRLALISPLEKSLKNDFRHIKKKFEVYYSVSSNDKKHDQIIPIPDASPCPCHCTGD